MHPKIVRLLIIWAVVLVVFMGLDWLIINWTPRQPAPMSAPASSESASTTTTATSTAGVDQKSVPVSIDFYCQEGTIAATFASGTVALNLSDGRAFTLLQTVSADGARYANGTVVFWNKGNNAFLTEGSKTTYSNCVAGTTAPASATSTTFTDNSKQFSFTYPNSYTLFGGDGSYTQDWEQNATGLGLLLAEVDVPQSVEPKTNFVEARFTVGMSADPNCMSATSSESGMPEQVSSTTINGVPFTKVVYSGEGMSQIYDTTSYRAIDDGVCYAVEYTIHSGNIGVYDPSLGIKPFNEASIQASLDTMVRSFTFLQ